MKSLSREISSLNYRIALKFDRHIGSSAAEVPVKFQSNGSNSKYRSRGFETSRDFMIRRLIECLNEALVTNLGFEIFQILFHFNVFKLNSFGSTGLVIKARVYICTS